MKSCSQIIWWLLPKKSWSLADTLGWLPSQDASDPKDLIVGVRLYSICMMNGFKKKHFAAKNHLADWGFVIALSPESAYQPLDLLELVAACRPDPPTALPKTGRDPPPDPRNSLHHDTKSRCPTPGALKGHNLDPQLPPCLNPRDFEGTHNPHRPGRQTKFWTPNNGNFFAKNVTLIYAAQAQPPQPVLKCPKAIQITIVVGAPAKKSWRESCKHPWIWRAFHLLRGAPISQLVGGFNAHQNHQLSTPWIQEATRIKDRSKALFLKARQAYVGMVVL